MVTSDFRPEVEIRPLRACAMHLAILCQFGHCGLGYWADLPRSTDVFQVKYYA